MNNNNIKFTGATESKVKTTVKQNATASLYKQTGRVYKVG